MRKTTLFAGLALTVFAAALPSPGVRAQAVPPGQADQARPVAGDPGISSMAVVDRPEFRVLRDYAEPGATRRMHSHDDATYHVLTLVTGQLRLTIEGEPPQDVKQGQVLTLKGGAKHTFTNTGTATATIVEVFGKQAGGAGRAGGAGDVQHLLYVAVPGVGNATDHGGIGILVFDMDHGYRFVKRIPTWTPATGARAEGVRGVAAHAGTARLYVSTNRRLAAFDLLTDKIVWEQTYDGKCCDRMAVTPDGKTLYVPATGGVAKWYVVRASDGTLATSINKEGSPHNTIVSDDGRFAYLESQGRQTPMLTVVDTATNTVVKEVGPFGNMVRPFTINTAQTIVYANINDVLGFEVADLRTGKVLHHVVVDGVPTENSPVHGMPSHGIALTQDETEVWLSDNTNHFMRVFDATVMPPVLKTSVKLRDEPGWISFSIDGRTAFPSTGDVVDVATKRVIATLTDENGASVESEKLLEIDFSGGKPAAAADQFGKGAKRR
ncbi:MAG TPA: cupin domain-containing protein [Vicinamibacterales bacterium]|nr:cupin domain-containing protein [Vicinamibacterales bacterium]